MSILALCNGRLSVRPSVRKHSGYFAAFEARTLIFGIIKIRRINLSLFW